MNKIIHLSDVHVGYAHCTNYFNEVVTRLIFKKQPAANYTVVITGDLVEDATVAGLYMLARVQVDRLRDAGYRVLICPGNHDYGTGSNGDKEFVELFRSTFLPATATAYPLVDIIGETAFIGLDTMADELNWHDQFFAQGELGGKQLTALSKALASAEVTSSKYRVVYMHHHPFDPRPFHGLKDSIKLGKILAGKIDCLLFGHNHDGGIWNGHWEIPRCYDAGSSTRKNIADPDKKCPHRVIDLDRDPPDPDHDFHP